MLCTSGFIDDIMFGRNGPNGDAWSSVAMPGWSLMFMNALFLIGIKVNLSDNTVP